MQWRAETEGDANSRRRCVSGGSRKVCGASQLGCRGEPVDPQGLARGRGTLQSPSSESGRLPLTSEGISKRMSGFQNPHSLFHFICVLSGSMRGEGSYRDDHVELAAHRFVSIPTDGIGGSGLGSDGAEIAKPPPRHQPVRSSDALHVTTKGSMELGSFWRRYVRHAPLQEAGTGSGECSFGRIPNQSRCRIHSDLVKRCLIQGHEQRWPVLTRS